MNSCEESPIPSLLSLAWAPGKFCKSPATTPPTRWVYSYNQALWISALPLLAVQPQLHLCVLPSCQCKVLSHVLPGDIACCTQLGAYRYHHASCQAVHPGYSYMLHPAARGTAVATLVQTSTPCPAACPQLLLHAAPSLKLLARLACSPFTPRDGLSGSH